jgi:hypothetical protein
VWYCFEHRGNGEVSFNPFDRLIVARWLRIPRLTGRDDNQANDANISAVRIETLRLQKLTGLSLFLIARNDPDDTSLLL